MMTLLSTAATGMQAQELRIEVISNNIANINTTAYQRQRAEFEDLLYQTDLQTGTSSSDAETIVPAGIYVGLGVKAAGVYRIPDQGELTQTSSDLDIAVRGKGYFRLEMPDGSFAYTRAGSFQTNADGDIVNLHGHRLSPGINVPQESTSLTINSSGQVIAMLAGQTEPQTLGQIDLVDFINPAGLEAVGDNLLLESAASGAPVVGIADTDQFGNLLQGWLESSNVNPVSEITDLIAAQRAYELNSKVIKAGDEMLQAINQTA